MIGYNEAIALLELYNIKRDCEAIKRVSLRMVPEVAVTLTPFVSLFCYEALEYMRKKGAEFEIESTSKYSIKDIRNKTKFFDVRMNQLLNTIDNVDTLQNIEFINYMKTSEVGRWNIHDNLGVFFDADGHIVSNTHYGYYVFQDENLIKKKLENLLPLENDPRLLPEEIKAYSYDMECIIRSLSDAFSMMNDFCATDICMDSLSIKYKDYNTNRIFVDKDNLYKTIRIFLLHTLSSVNFVLYVLKKCIIRDSGWLLRIEYITYHYLIKRLNLMSNFVSVNASSICDVNLFKVLNNMKLDMQNSELINTEFRNCMMHYSVRSKDGKILVEEEYLDLAQPLGGLVESLYAGSSYWDLQEKIEKELAEISKYLTEYLDLDFRSAELE